MEADLNPALRGRKVSIAYLQQPQPFTILMAHDDQERRPIGLLTMGHAMARFATPMAAGEGPEVLDDGAVAMGFGVELTPADGVPPTGSGPGSAAGPARRLRRLARIGPSRPPPSSGASSAPF